MSESSAIASSAVVTIIVPGRDVAAFAFEAVQSLRAQTLPSWRAILIDDGSVDDTGAIFERAARSDHRIQVVRLPASVGLGAARNLGLSLVETPLVGFLDADDVMLPGALDRLVSVLDASGSDFVAGAYVRLRPQGAGGEASYEAGEVQPWVRAATDPARRGVTLREHPAASANIVAWSKVSRIDLWRRCGLRFAEGGFFEDQQLAQRMLTAARAFDVVPDVVMHWRERADGTSITQRTDRLEVLGDYLDGLTAGIDHLRAHDQTAAVESRVRLILSLDAPPLVRIGAAHPEDAYRRRLGAFLRRLTGTAPEIEVPADVAAGMLW